MSDRDPFERIRQRREEEEQRLRRNRRRSMMMVLGLGVLLFVIRLAFPSGSAEENGGASSSLASSAVSSAPAAGTGTISQDGWNLILVNNENLLPQDFQVPLTTLVGSYRVDARTVGFRQGHDRSRSGRGDRAAGMLGIPFGCPAGAAVCCGGSRAGRTAGGRAGPGGERASYGAGPGFGQLGIYQPGRRL